MSKILLLASFLACSCAPPSGFSFVGCRWEPEPELGFTVPEGQCLRFRVTSGDSKLTVGVQDACEVGSTCVAARPGEHVVPYRNGYALVAEGDFSTEVWPCNELAIACEPVQ